MSESNERLVGRRDCYDNRIWIIQSMVFFQYPRKMKWQHASWVQPLAFGIKADAERKLKELRDEGREEVRRSGHLKAYHRRYRIVEVGVVDSTFVEEPFCS
jgi:hypothetical protein